MTGLSIAINEMYRSSVRLNCHPEEACARRRRNASATRTSHCHIRKRRRPTKDLLQHQISGERLPISLNKNAAQAFLLRRRSEGHVLQQRGTHGNLVFVFRVNPVQNRQLKPLFESHVPESRGSWTAMSQDNFESRSSTIEERTIRLEIELGQ